MHEMLRISYTILWLWLALNGGLGLNLDGQIDKIFSVLMNEISGCDVNTLPDTVDWCNGTLSAGYLLPDFTVCQANEQSDTYLTNLLCRSGIWWNGNTPFRHSHRHKRSGIGAVVTLEKKESCTWICAVDETDFVGRLPPVFEQCPNSTVLYPEGNSSQVTYGWQTPAAKDVDGNITSFERIVGPSSPVDLEATKTPGTVYHVSYMAEDDEKLKWTCYFTINAEIPVCPAIVNFKHGEYYCDNDNHRGSTCTFQCENGYYLNTTNSTTCQDDGTWTFGDDKPECFPITCGDPTANSTDIQFLCSGDSYEFGSVCWARCKYGYILRNEQQEQQEEATLIEMVDQAFIKLNDAKLARERAENTLQLADENLRFRESEAGTALGANVSAATAAAQAEKDYNSLVLRYNESYIAALQAQDDAEQGYANNATDVDELQALAENLTTVAEKLRIDLDIANDTFIKAAEAANLANIAATDAVDKAAAARMYLNESEITLENKIVEEDEALSAHNDATNRYNDAIVYNGGEDKVVNTFAFCEADGTWTIPGEPYCIDTEPPLLKCIPIYTLYLDPGKTSVKGIWPVPKLQDSVQDIADVIQLTGPVNGTELEPGQYVANYIARDRSGNISPNCSMIINVEVRTCKPPTEDIIGEDLLADCDSYIAGSRCSLICRQKTHTLEGNDWVACEDDPTTKTVDFIWNFNNSVCIEAYCPKLPEPVNGKMVCENTTEGDKCSIICNQNYMLPYKSSGVFHCGESGVWSPATLPAMCIERGETQYAEYILSISYISTNGSTDCIDIELEDERIAIDTALRSYLQNFRSCEEDYECLMKDLTIECMEDEDGLRTVTLNILTTCPDNTESLCDLTNVIMDNFKTDLTEGVENEGILDHLNLTLIVDWLNTVAVDIPVCLNGSILVGAYCAQCDIGNFMNSFAGRCDPCPIGSYGDIPGQASCIPCPSGTNTTGIGKTSVRDCKALCSPGSFSNTSMVPCLTCKLGTFQNSSGRTSCNKCPSGTWTTIPGADSQEKCIVVDLYFEEEFPTQDLAINIPNMVDMSAIFWIKGFDIPILTFGLFYDEEDTDYAFLLVTEENIQIFSDGSDNTPTDVMMNSNEWIMLVVVWNALEREIKLYKNGELAFTMKTKERPEDPNKVVLSVKQETFLSGFVLFPYIIYQELIDTAYSECGTIIPGYQVVTSLADRQLNGIKPVPSTCKASEFTAQDNCGNHGCQNGGICIHNDTVGYTCNCTVEFGGHFCEVELVHGNWSEWINATDCSVTCGIGVRAVYRLCNNPSPGPYAKDCEGNSTDFVECQRKPCQECVVPSETSVYGTICNLKDDECTPTCKDGRVLPKGQREQKFRCGVSTNYEWVPMDRLPICARANKPSEYVLVASFEVRPEVPCEYLSNITAGYEEVVATLLCPSQTPNCTSAVKFNDCSPTKKRATPSTTVLVLTFIVTLTKQEDFDLEEYFVTRNMTDSIQETVTAIYDMELTIKQILDTPRILDVLFLNVTYTIVPGSEQITARTVCLPSFVGTQGVCVQCQPGTRLLNDWCVYCERGTYQNLIGHTVCTPCPEGKTTIFVGARSELECIEIITEPPAPTPPPVDIGPIIIIVVCVIAGIIAVLVLICTFLKFYIMSKRRQQYDMEAETTSLFTEFPDIAYNMYFKNRQVMGFDEKGIPIIAKEGFENGDAKFPFYDDKYPFGDPDEKLPPLIPPLEPFSFSARPVHDSPFDHPPPKLKKKSFVKPSMEPIKHFNFPDMREIPVRFKVPKRKRFQNKYPRHTFGLPDEDETYISQKVPIPKNATRLLYKSPTGQHMYAYLFKGGLIKTVPVYDEEGVEPDLPLLKSQYFDENGEFEQPPPVFEKLKLGDEPKSSLKRLGLGSAAESGSTWMDSRPSTAHPGSRPSTTKSKGRTKSTASPRTPRSGRSPRSRGAPHLDRYRFPTSPDSPRAKSAMQRDSNGGAKSVSILENGQVSRPTTAATFMSQARSSRHSNARIVGVAETYRPKSVNIYDLPGDYSVQNLPPGLSLNLTTPTLDDQMSNAPSKVKDHKMKFMAPPVSKSRPKSVTPVPPLHPEDDGNLEESGDELGDNRREVRFDNDDVENDYPDSDSSGSIIFTKSKKVNEKMNSRVSQTSISRKSNPSMNGTVSRTPRASVSGSLAPRPSFSEGMKAFAPSKDFVLNQNLPPRGHHLKASVKPTTISIKKHDD